MVGTAVWPRLAVKAWKDKLLDAVSDRCVRLCRRDPRDSAEAEQSLFEQLDDSLDRYANVARLARDAVAAYADDVRSGRQIKGK